VRGNAALALLHVVVVPLKRGRTSELVSKVVERVLLVGVSDVVTDLRCQVLRLEFDGHNGNY
jgi:hypothetical protein